MRRLLAPFALIYWAVTRLRLWMFDCGILASRTFSVPVICVGNITVGGTGKTPLIEHLIALLENDKKVGVVSRGYRRKSKGQVIASSSSTAADIGDEPRQMLSKFPNSLMVVDADRAAAIDKTIALGANVVLMDDGMQHRSVRPTTTICVCDYARPMYSDLPLPAGNLREPWCARLRADIIIVNKCPLSLSSDEAKNIEQKLNLSAGQSLFFSAIAYGNLSLLDKENDPDSLTPDVPILAIAGIGRPEPFFQEVERRFNYVKRMAFDDHHPFSAADEARIADALNALGRDSIIICTEKDSVRLPSFSGHASFSLPIKTQFLFDKEPIFNQIIKSRIC